MPRKKSTQLIIASCAAIGIAASSAPANAAETENTRAAAAQSPVVAVSDPIMEANVVREFKIQNRTGFELNIEKVTGGYKANGESRWVQPPRVGDAVVNLGPLAVWSLKAPFLVDETARAQITLAGISPKTNKMVKFLITLNPNILQSSIWCQTTDPENFTAEYTGQRNCRIFAKTP